MNIITPSIEIVSCNDYKTMLEKLEKIGRVCYKSEGNIKEGSAERFIESILHRGHESVIEHESITVAVTCDRGDRKTPHRKLQSGEYTILQLFSRQVFR